MNLEDLRAAQVDERETDSLQPLAPSFYEQAGAYLAELHERRERLADRVDDPFRSAEVRRLTDEIETAEEVVEAVYERRVGKLVKRASLAAAGMPADDAGLTEEEQALFSAIVETIETNRETVLAVVGRGGGAPGGPSPVPDGTPQDHPERPPTSKPPEPDEARADRLDGAAGPDVVGDAEPDGGAAMDASGPPSTESEPDRLTVRMTAAVGEIYGVDDRVYTLDAEDVVTLPAANARPLLDRGAAQRVR